MTVLVFIETPKFSQLVEEYLTDDEYSALQQALMDEPEAGDVVKGSGGVRKLRWAAPGRGKSAGYRVIYFLKNEAGVVWMLTMYAKNEKSTIPGYKLAQIRKVLEDD